METDEAGAPRGDAASLAATPAGEIVLRTLYMAGPEVFLPDASEVMALKRRLAREHGFEPTGPGSDEAAAGENGIGAHEIYLRNERAMRDAEVCVANLTPFRGVSADVGTVHEVGFMLGLQRLVWGYTNDPRGYGERVRAEWPGARPAGEASGGEGANRGSDGLMIESFGLCDNLMIEAGIESAGGRVLRAPHGVSDPARDLAAFAECLRRIAQAPAP